MTTPAVSASLLIYDIPDTAKIPNPSPALRRRAVRVNLSCWVIPNHAVPYVLLDEMQENGATWHVVKFDASEAGTLLRMASESLRRDVLKAVASCEESVRRAEDKADENGEDEAFETLDKYLKSTSAAIRRTNRLLADYRAAAEGFGVPVVELGITGALSSIQGIQTGVRRQAKVYREIADRCRAAGADGPGLANAMEDGSVHIGIPLDYLQERGEDVADARETFAANLSP